MKNASNNSAINQSSNKKDYDKEPIIVKDYGNFYHIFIYISFFVVVIAICGKDAWIRDGIYQGKVQIVTGAIVVFILSFLLIKNSIKYFQKSKQVFIFNSNSLKYSCYGEETIKSIDKISAISHLFIAGNTTGKNIYQNRSIFQLFFKTDILELFFYLFSVIYTTILHLIFILPFRIFFQKAFFILNKNFLILFEDGSFMSIIINNQKEYNEIKKYFKYHNININDKVKFIQINYKEL
ncbi:hypothetical protein F1B92_05330 [Campylobacter sp. FMV-PI01]|uniref:Uncharacterized protein n=1 Tax=Campylobacter portucalensis TaxID=2608384 RepID=A0A6L5WLM8_9BACT|nr:hypothetical protein [Campylobacter portucalensis]MSN96591.1 hypothetical protein [Campylobacter portucalensis]